jgi:hypothetical protein
VDGFRVAVGRVGAIAFARAARHGRDWIARWHGPDGLLARTWQIRSMGLWVLAMMLAVLVANYLSWR